MLLGYFFRFLPIAALTMVVAGCGPRSTVVLPKWNPDIAADRCMEQYDKNGDGVLSKDEYSASPALTYAAAWLDENGDGVISREEIRDRIQLYQDARVAPQFVCYVFLNNRGMGDAQVRLIPEEFLSDFLQEKEGMSAPDGMVVINETNSGLYRVEITHPNVQIRKDFNTESTLGVEVSPVTVPGQAGPPRYTVQRGQ